MCKEFQAPAVSGIEIAKVETFYVGTAGVPEVPEDNGTAKPKAIKKPKVTAAAFDRLSLSVSKAASKDDTRRNLSGIYFEGNKTVATNGHILSMVENPGPEPVYKPFIVAAVDIPKVAKNEKLEFKPEDIDKVSARFTVSNCKPGSVRIQTAELIDADFPDYSQVMPKTEPAFSIRLDARLISLLMDIHTGVDTRIAGVDFHFWDDLSPVKLVSELSEGRKITSLCMPLRK